MAAGGYRDLRVWHRAMELTVACYRCTRRLPPEERFELARQIRRAGVSIAANIAEGNARSHRGDYLHFLSIARGSAAELMTHLELVERLGYATEADLRPLRDSCEAVSSMLIQLQRSLRDR